MGRVELDASIYLTSACLAHNEAWSEFCR